MAVHDKESRSAGNTEANKQVKVPEDHDSSSGTQNPNKGKNDARGVTDDAREKQGGSGEIISCRSRNRAEQCCSLS